MMASPMLMFDANVDVDASNVNVSTNASTNTGIACNVTSIAKLSQGGKVKERQKLCLPCTVGLK